MGRDYNFYIYIMASESGTIYVGFTNDIIRRIEEYKSDEIEGFTKKYSCHKLVYYEYYKYVYNAMNREREIKKWRRDKKEYLINTLNPHRNDLYVELLNQ